MTTHKISNDFYEHSYALIAIHCPLEDYRLAYFLNSYLHTKLKRSPDLDFHDNTASFFIYEWEDREKDSMWNLICNTATAKSSKTESNNTLLGKEAPLKTNYLIPEKKQTDYFLKIDGETGEEDTTAIVNTIRKIPQLITTYTIDPDQLKSRNHLII